MSGERRGETNGVPVTTIRAEDWPGSVLAGQVFDGVRFVGLDLSEQDERAARFSACTFDKVSFNASIHRDAAFLNCAFVDCSFFDVRFIDCKLVGSTFERCRIGPLAVEGGDWSLVGLRRADLRQTAWRTVRMREADLTGANLDGATVRDVDLLSATLHRATFNGTDLRGSDLSSLDPRQAELRDAVIDVEQALVLAIALGLRLDA